jgi:hypothetical protein
MNIKRYFLSLLIIFLTGVIHFPLKAQPPKGTPLPNFSGEWKAKESISMGGNIVCSYDTGDRMVSKTIKIVEQGDFLTIENPNQDAGASLATSREKLIFDGKTRQISNSQANEKKASVKLSNDGHTMTINSIVYFMNATPYQINVRKQAFTNVTEVWNLSNDGNSISVSAKATSNIWNEERSWETVFVKIN